MVYSLNCYQIIFESNQNVKGIKSNKENILLNAFWLPVQKRLTFLSWIDQIVRLDYKIV